MASKKQLKPRKLPRQERARATVDAILQAATYILVKDGWDKFNTNRVADRAGVNIASLYQYFPSKEALVLELQRRHAQKAHAAFPELLPTLRTKKTLRGILRVMIEAGLREHSVAPALHRVFSQELPRTAQLTPPDDGVAAQFAALVFPFMKNVPNPMLALHVAGIAAHAAIHDAANEHPERLSDPAFAEELVTLLERYLARPAKRAATT